MACRGSCCTRRGRLQTRATAGGCHSRWGVRGACAQRLQVGGVGRRGGRRKGGGQRGWAAPRSAAASRDHITLAAPSALTRAHSPRTRAVTASLVVVVRILLRLLEPRDKGLGGLAHLAAELLLGALLVPLDDRLLLEEVDVIQGLEDGGRLLEQALRVRRLAHQLLDEREQMLLRLGLVGRRLEQLGEELGLRLQLLHGILVEVALKDETEEVVGLQLVLLRHAHQRLDALVEDLLGHRLLDLLADPVLLELKLVHAQLFRLLLHLLQQRVLLRLALGDGLVRHVHRPIAVVVVVVVVGGRRAGGGGGRHLLFLLLLLLLLSGVLGLLLLALVGLLLLLLGQAHAAHHHAALVVGRVVQDVRRQLVPHVRHAVVAARLAVKVDVLLLDLHRRLRQLAARAQHPLLDELVGLLLQHRRFVPAGDRARALVHVEPRHVRAQFDRAVLGQVLRRPLQRLCDVGRVREHSALAVAAPLLLADDRRHLVAICRVVPTTDVDKRHLFLICVIFLVVRPGGSARISLSSGRVA
mmetsp:Transcript_46843/g.130148  ORF Transcript_46843/g.130148 Transcript_46843/m.130148 type:complete len:527 (-) Transcript_46843:50-1630(-)